MSRLKLLLDVDEVICFSTFLQFVNEFLGTSYNYDDFENYYIDEEAIPKERMEEFINFCKEKNHYQNPDFLPGALESIERLKEYYDIYICSDCRNVFDLESSGRILKNKFDMLYKYIPQETIPAKKYIFTGTKDIFKVDVKVDDLVSNLEDDTKLKILFPSYHNKNISDIELENKGIIKSGNDWHEGWTILEQILIEYAKSQKED